MRWIVWGAALAIGILAGVAIGLVRSVDSTQSPALGLGKATEPSATWPAGARPAPDFTLTDQAGDPVSLARFRGRPVLLTFMDPLCRDFCPREARVLASVQARLPASERPAIVAVSVNQWGNARRNLLTDIGKWKVGKSEWHWAVGSPARLRRVWSDYAIGVRDTPKTVTGVTVHDITHTEATYLMDAHGDQRALFLYPFRAADVVSTVRRLLGARG